jgi:hypothetical protein
MLSPIGTPRSDLSALEFTSCGELEETGSRLFALESARSVKVDKLLVSQETQIAGYNPGVLLWNHAHTQGPRFTHLREALVAVGQYAARPCSSVQQAGLVGPFGPLPLGGLMCRG